MLLALIFGFCLASCLTFYQLWPKTWLLRVISLPIPKSHKDFLTYPLRCRHFQGVSPFLVKTPFISKIWYLEPKESPKPQPIGNMPMIFLLTTCTLCVLFLIWRRADALRRVVSHKYVFFSCQKLSSDKWFCLHRLKTLTRSEGPIRLSNDEGPPANEFLADDYDEDNEHLDDSDDTPLSEHIRRATQVWREPVFPQSNSNAQDNIKPPSADQTSWLEFLF